VNARIERLREAVEREYGCRAEHVDSRVVIERGRSKKWEASLEVFDLIGYPDAQRCHAWFYKKGLWGQAVTVLELQPPE
jgi:hypothetical protein